MLVGMMVLAKVFGKLYPVDVLVMLYVDDE